MKDRKELILSIAVIVSALIFMIGTVGLASLLTPWLGVTLLGAEGVALCYYIAHNM